MPPPNEVASLSRSHSENRIVKWHLAGSSQWRVTISQVQTRRSIIKTQRNDFHQTFSGAFLPVPLVRAGLCLSRSSDRAKPIHSPSTETPQQQGSKTKTAPRKPQAPRRIHQ